MTREQYNTQRTKLMNDMRAAIDAGDTATANSCRDQVRALDNQWEAEAQARADFAALQNSARSFTPADVTPAQTNAATQIVNFAAVPQGTQTDPSETAEYRNAFMAYVCRGTEIPADLRASVAPMLNVAATTTTTDAGAVIPTTITREIIREMKSYGNLYAKIRKLNVQGGVEFPILALKPTANWIGESKSSDDQKLTANTKLLRSGMQNRTDPACVRRHLRRVPADVCAAGCGSYRCRQRKGHHFRHRQRAVPWRYQGHPRAHQECCRSFP